MHEDTHRDLRGQSAEHLRSSETPRNTRRYRQGRRRESVEATRRRITEAAVRLHGTIGPARTTISAIAEEAGVQRLTVYRHFPDADALFAACMRHYDALHPPPSPAGWRRVRDPDERLRLALGELYSYWETNGAMIGNLRRDLAAMPSFVAEDFERMYGALTEALLEGRPGRAVRRRVLEAAVGHALAFETWRSLVREQGLSREEAVDLMVGFVARA